MSHTNIEKILHDFYTVSGMDISIVDSDFHTLSLTKNPEVSLCSAIHRDPNSIDVCKASDIERLSSVKNDARPVLYTCPFGITEAIVPIIRDDETIGYIISALGIEKGKEDNILNTVSLCHSIDDAEIKSLISSSRSLSPDELNAYFNMLRMLASYISSDDSLIERQKSIGQLIKRYIKNNLQRKLTLKNISRNLHCSTVTLTEHFKAEFGFTINEYITKKRMDLAEKMLLTTDKPLREIASLVGFSDVEYFSRTFKKYHDQSPAAWRREKGANINDHTKNTDS